MFQKMFLSRFVDIDHSCGYATLHDVFTKTKEDRMESFFLSETCKYLFLVSVKAKRYSTPPMQMLTSINIAAALLLAYLLR